MPKPVIDEDDGGHGLDDGDGAGNDAWVVPSATFKGGGFTGAIDRFLAGKNGGGGFKGDPEGKELPIGDPTLNPSGVVGAGANGSIPAFEDIVVLIPGQEGSGKATPDFKAFGSRKGEHGLGEIGLEPVEDRGTEADGKAGGAAFNEASDGIAGIAHFLDAGNHGFCDDGIRTANGGGFNIFEGGKKIKIGQVHLDIVDPGDVGPDVDISPQFKDFSSDCACSNPGDGFAGAGASAALVIPDTEFRLVGKVRVGGAEFFLHFLIGLGHGVFIGNDHGDGGPEGEAVVGSGEDADGIGLLALGGDFTLAGTASVQFRLNIILGKG